MSISFLAEALEALSFEFSSDAFAILVYRGSQPDWRHATKLLTEPTGFRVPLLNITSPDGRTRRTIACEDFLLQPASAPAMTVSADWSDDGYVTASFMHNASSGLTTECYFFGALRLFENAFLGTVISRFRDLNDSQVPTLLGIDPEGSSAEEEWSLAYCHERDIPPTAVILGVPATLALPAPGFEVVEHQEGYELRARSTPQAAGGVAR